MDLSLKTMYDAFKYEIWKELGQLDPNWFEVLTAQTSPNERIVPDKDELCANQEGNFKTPLEKTAVDSQLFSTPKVFRQIRTVSPEPEDERSFTAAQERAPVPWTATQSPCLFHVSGQGALGEKCEAVEPHSEDSLDLLSTPNKSSVKYAKHISESLGAQINPDISWTSSLNTPPAVPSTLILSKTDESPCPLSVTADRNFVFVRKLFPSLSKASSVDVPKNKATPPAVSVSQGAVSYETQNCLQSSLNQAEGVWQQKPPDDVDDEEVCSKVEENLDAAETVDSNFFANSSSALRKVKPGRIKCKQIIQTNEKKCSSKDVTGLHCSPSSEEATADLKSGRLPSTPLSKTRDPAISQWSPLNLSEIPSCALESSVLTKQGDTESVQLFKPSNITDFGFIKQKRKFVYTIPSLKAQVQGKENQSQKMDSAFGVSDCGQELNVKPLEKVPGESEGCNIQKNSVQNQRKIIGENGGAKIQDFDMSQLCKEFAKDFSQAVIFGQKDKAATNSLNNFSPSTCLSAMKQAKQIAKQANLLHESDGINNRRQTCLITPGTVSDSGMQSGFADVTRTTSSSENAGSSRQCVSTFFPFTKEEIWKEHLEADDKRTLQKFMERETLDLGKESGSHIESKPTCQPSSTEVVQKGDCISLSSQICDSLPKKTNVSLSSAYSSGFRTASDKGIHISPASLERAKCLFEETEGKTIFNNQFTKYDLSAKPKISLSNGPLTSKTSTSNQLSHLEETLGNVSSQLTASEKADVTELCSVLEDADSQFDFTQSKMAKLIQQDQDDANPSQKPGREFDPDFLTGINFDDSFNSDGGKNSASTVMLDKMALVSDQSTSQSTDLSSTVLKNQSSSVAPFLENISDDSNHFTSTRPNNFHTTEHSEPSKLNNCNPLVLDVAFTTAGGNMLRLSKTCLSKARALFADLEENLTDQNPPGKQNANIDAKTDQNCSMDYDLCKKVLMFTSKDKCHVEKNVQDCFSKTKQSVCPYKQVSNVEDNNCTKSFKNNKMDTKVLQSDFHTASGKEISISTNCMQQADAFFKDCNIMGHKDDMSHKKDVQASAKSTENKKSFSKYKNLKVNTSEEHVAGCTKSEKVNAGLIALHTKEPDGNGVDVSSNGSLALKDAKSFHGNPFTTSVPFSTPCPSNIDLSAFNGFSTASGKKVSVSADAVRRAECLLNQINTHDDVNLQLNQKESAKNTGDCRDEVLNAEHMGFQTAQGKEVAFLSAAQKKTKALIKKCKSDKDAASGEPVVVSSEDLKTKTICTDISLSIDIPTVFNTRGDEKHKDAQDKTEKRHCGFTTAGGAKVHVSQKNLLKAKDLFNDFDDLDLTKAMREADAFFDCDVDDNESVFPEGKKDDVDVNEGAKSKKENLYPDQSIAVNNLEESKIRSVVDTSKQVKQKNETLPQQSSGFQTASGKSVHISFEALKKAKTLLSDCERAENKLNATLPQSKVGVLPCRNASFISGKGKPVTLSPEALQKAQSLLSDIGTNAEIPDISRTTKSDKKHNSGNNTEKLFCGFTTAGGAKVHVSEKNLLKAKRLFEECDNSTKTSLDADVSFKKETDCIVSSNSEILSKNKSKAVCSEVDSLNKNVFKLQSVTRNVIDEPENGFTKDIKEQVKQREEALRQQKSGFQTASGKSVAVSSEALTKAKILLNENEAKENMHVSLPSSKNPVTETFPWKSGFSSASGKPVTFSSEALQKAQALFSDTSLSTNNSTLPDTKRSDEKHDVQSKAEYIHCGFMTAGGGQVHVSEKSLVEAKHFLKEFADEEHSLLSNPTSPQNTMKLELPKAKNVERTDNLTSVSDENIHVKRSDPCERRSFSTTKGVDDLKDIVEESNTSDCNINQTNYSKTTEVQRTEESSDLNLQLLNLTGCTETQHKFLAQEALDCTKALLEDEVLAGQNLLVTSEDTTQPDEPKSSNRLTEDEKGRKRLLKDTDITGHPPSKRRLLDEFDRTVDSSKGSVLRPVKSCPHGLIKDRGVFKYSASLHPNITNPHSASKHYKDTRFQKTLPQTSASGDGRASHPKMLFVPPFIKNATREIPKNPDRKENTRTPVFVPPFKKQRTVLQDAFSKQEEQDKCQLTSTVEPTNNIYVPPAIKTQSTTEVAASVDTRNQNVSNISSVPVNCELMSSEAEAPVEDDTFSNDQDEHQNIELARDMQDMRIKKKKRQTVRPLPGSLFLTKTSGVARISLKAAVNGKNPASCNAKQLYESGVQKNVFEITSETAESFRFNLLQFVKRETFKGGDGVHLADGGWLIPSNDWTAGKEEFYRALCDTPGVDPKLISEAWVYNHYRWIVWKQASMEKSFPETMGSLCLTPEQVLLQLKYRYDVEVDHSRRPALRKIMEKDDTAAKTLVLCVCEIISKGHAPNRQSHHDTKTPQSADAKMETSCAVVRLTDGWYAVRAQLDEPLTAMLHKGLLAVGVKLIIHGAQLMGSQDACSPLEAPDSLVLKICANSSRRARWDAKLGFHRDPRPFLLPLSSLFSNGGPIGCVDVVILRSYPIQWMERKADGGIVFRSSRAEEKEARRFNNHKQTAMETLFAKIQAEFEKEDKGNSKLQRRRQSISHQDVSNLQDGEELYEAVGDDPTYIEAKLSEQQLETLHAYKRSLMEKKQAKLQDRYRRALEAEDNKLSCPKRDVTPVWRLYIADSKTQSNHVHQLNLWRPSSDLQSLLKEGCRYKVYNLVASGGQQRSGIETVQLTGTKKTQFQDLQASQEWLSEHFQPRVSTNFVNLQNAEFQPLCGEVDLTGCVISVIDEHGASPAFYLADGKLNFVKVRCFSGLSQAGLEDVIKPRALLALSNLQLRGQSLHPTPVVYAGDLTVFSTNPKDVHLQESFRQLKNLLQCQNNFFQVAEEKLSLLVKSAGSRFIYSPSLRPQTPVSETGRKQESKTIVTFQKADQNLGSFTPVGRNPPAGTSSSEKDSKSLKRRRALDYLSRIPSPPPLSHLASAVSPCVNKTFNPPRRSGPPSTLKSAKTPVQKPTDSLVEDGWVNDEELAMIDTQALHVGDLL